MGYIERIMAYMKQFAPAKTKSTLLRLNPHLQQRIPFSSELPLVHSFFGNEMADYVGHACTYSVYPWLQRAIILIAQSTSHLPFVVTEKKTGQRIESHPVSTLLTFPNNTMPSSLFYSIATMHYFLSGEMFIEVVSSLNGSPVELWLRRPDRTLVVPEDNLAYPRIREYRFLDVAINGTPVLVDPEHVIHSRIPNPLSFFRGLSPVASVLRSIKADRSMQDQMTMLSDNFARPDYVLSYKEILTDPQRDTLMDLLRSREPGIPIIVDDGAVITPLTFPPKDIEGLHIRGYNRDEVAGIFGIPDILMGFGQDSYDTEEKRTAALKMFWEMTLLPFIRHRDSALNHYFTRINPLLENGLVLSTDTSSVAVLRDDISRKIDDARKVWEMGVPFNQIDAVFGLGVGEIEEGDVGFIPSSMTRIDEIESSSTEEAKSIANALFVKQNEHYVKNGKTTI